MYEMLYFINGNNFLFECLLTGLYNSKSGFFTNQTRGASWNLFKENREAGQFMFQNQNNKVIISISARDNTKFEFYNPTLVDIELVDTFYKWDADFWKSKVKCEIQTIKKDTSNRYIVWHLIYGKAENYFLYGLRVNYLIGLNAPKQKMDENELIKLLEDTYLK
ncbi:MAG: hypothetical protein ABUL44_01155 [Flavobacterium sp.]